MFVFCDLRGFSKNIRKIYTFSIKYSIKKQFLMGRFSINMRWLETD